MRKEKTSAINGIAQQVFGGIPYTFIREDGFYPLVLKDDADAIANAKCNPGTLKVVNELTGEAVYEV
jgi:hypothetical protein